MQVQSQLELPGKASDKELREKLLIKQRICQSAAGQGGTPLFVITAALHGECLLQGNVSMTHTEPSQDPSSDGASQDRCHLSATPALHEWEVPQASTRPSAYMLKGSLAKPADG